MRYKVTLNGEEVIISDNLKHAADAYNKTIYFGKEGDIIRMYYRPNPNTKWMELRKDWL